METEEDKLFNQAVWQDKCDVVDEMLSADYVPRKRTIELACVQHRIDMLTRLLKYPMNIQQGFTAAVVHGFVPALDHLYLAGIDINYADDYGNTSLHKTNNVEIAKWLLDMGATQLCNSWGETPLHLACKYRRLEIAKLLLSFSAGVESISVADNYGDVPMHHACEGNPKLVELLLSYPGGGQSLTKVNSSGYTPAYWPCRYGCTETIKLILQVPEGVQSLIMEDNCGNTALFEACSQHNVELLQCLLQHPEIVKCINKPDHYGTTCLTAGCDSRVQALLQTYTQ